MGLTSLTGVSVNNSPVFLPTMIPIGDSTVFAAGTVGIFELICALSGGRFQMIRNAGVNGNTTSQMAARFATDVAAYGPGYVFIMGVVNNATYSFSNGQAARANYLSMCQAALAIGAIPIIVAACPYNTLPNSVQAYNESFQKMAQTYGFRYIDPWKTCVNPANGNWIDATYSTDGTHPTPKAARIAAQYALTQLELPTFYPLVPQNNADTTGQISNCLFLNNTVPGTPNGWTIDAAFTPSLTAGAGDILGNLFNIQFSGLTAYKQCSGPISFSGLAAGNQVQIVGRVESTGFEANGAYTTPCTGICDASLNIGFSGAGGGPYLFQGMAADIPNGIFSASAVLPAGTTGLSLTVTVGSRSGASISGTLSLAQLQVYNLTGIP